MFEQSHFNLLYGREGSPLTRAVERIRSHFPVVVYLPGNLMPFAATFVKARIAGLAWESYGDHEGTRATYPNIWEKTSSVSVSLAAARTNGADVPTIFNNLESLHDGHGNLISTNEASTALFYLNEACRLGVVLGLCDIAAGPLPEVLRRPFAEEVWLDEAPIDGVKDFIADQLPVWCQRHPEAPDMLGLRLRWCNPITAATILSKIPQEQSPNWALNFVTARTRSLEFSDPAALQQRFPPDPDTDPPGYDKATITAIRNFVIKPYTNPLQNIPELPPGMILWGPPGTGKSDLAHWLASQLNIPFRQVSGADLKRPDWGLTERLVSDLFRSARRAAPCMIVLDDADDLLLDRKYLQGSVSGGERGVVNAFLQEIAGFRGRAEGVFVVLTTNHFERLDAAAKSRLDLRFRIPFPLEPEQVIEIVAESARRLNAPLDPDVQKALASFFYSSKPGYVGPASAEQRGRLDSGFYSPRDIAAGVRMVVSANGTRGAVDAMKTYFQSLDRETLKNSATE